MTLRRGIFFFLLFSISVSAFVVSRSIDGSTISALKNLNWSVAFWVFSLMAGAWLCDAGRFCLVARSMGYHISLWRGMTLGWLNYFGCAVTPLQVGGGPFQVYILYKNDQVPVGSGIAITLLRTLLSTFILSILAPSALFLAPELLQSYGLARGMFVYVSVLSLVVWSLFILSVCRPRWIQQAIGRLTLRLRRFRSMRKLPVVSIYRRVGREMMSYSSNVSKVWRSGHRGAFLAAFVLSCGHMLCLFSVLPVMVRSLGLSVPYAQAVSAQAMLLFTLYFMPTPGGSGVAEGGSAALFGLLVPGHLAGVMAIAWRFVTEYIAILIGAFVALRMIGWGQAQELISGAASSEERGEHEGN